MKRPFSDRNPAGEEDIPFSPFVPFPFYFLSFISFIFFAAPLAAAYRVPVLAGTLSDGGFQDLLTRYKLYLLTYLC